MMGAAKFIDHFISFQLSKSVSIEVFYCRSKQLNNLTPLVSRHVAPSVSEDLACLFDQKLFTDADLVFKNTVFPVHKAILSVR